jgi:hypothetical protein
MSVYQVVAAFHYRPGCWRMLHPRWSRLLPTRERERSECNNSANRQVLKHFLLCSTGLRTALSLLSALFKFVYRPTIKYSTNAEISTLLPAGGKFRSNFCSLRCKLSQLEPLLSHLLPISIFYIMFLNPTNSLNRRLANQESHHLLPQAKVQQPAPCSYHAINKQVSFLSHYILTIPINIILHYSMYVRNSGKLKGREHQADLGIDKR